MIDTTFFPDWEPRTFRDFLKWRWGMRGQTVAMPPADELDKVLPVRRPDASALAAPPTDGRMQATWLGHASVLIQWDGWCVLADPIFSERCSPVQWAGPRRVRPAPLCAAELPPVDVVVISHNHYDHLDYQTVRDLVKAQPSALFCVPLGMKCWFADVLGKTSAAQRVIEMDWSESLTLTHVDVVEHVNAVRSQEAGAMHRQNATSAAEVQVIGRTERPSLTVVCIPCQHWCKRTPTDDNKCLWSSWIAQTPTRSFYFGGDTGYCGEIFRTVGAIYGPINVAAIPIGAFGVPSERWFHKVSHMDPFEAVRCHYDLRAEHSMAIHWGTFPLTGEPILDPPTKLAIAREAATLDAERFVCFEHGETRVFGSARDLPELRAGEMKTAHDEREDEDMVTAQA